MRYLDKLLELLADWFMDYFLDPAYVVETTDGRFKTVSMSHRVTKTDVLVIKPRNDVQPIETNSSVVAVAKDSSLGFAGLKRMGSLTDVLFSHLNLKKVARIAVVQTLSFFVELTTVWKWYDKLWLEIDPDG